MTTQSTGYRLRPISSLRDALKLRELRNQVRLYMTHNTNEISVPQQVLWYYFTYKPANEKGQLSAYLLEIPFETLNRTGLVGDAMVLGFGILSFREFLAETEAGLDYRYRWTVTGGLAPAFRGMGFGRIIFRFLSSIPTEDVWLDVWETNLPAISLYKAIGYEEVYRMGGLITMRLPR